MGVIVTTHSKVGASSAERWMNCEGSVALIDMLGEDEYSDEPEYRRAGTEAHEVAAECLRTGADAWEYVGSRETFDVEASAAVQVYLDIVRNLEPGAVLVEEHLSDPSHPMAFGTADHILFRCTECDVTDYKHGVGVAVDVEHNVQLMYYAYLVLLRTPHVELFRLRIVQPRGFHRDGPVREWTISAADLRKWAEDELYPKMDAALIGTELTPGTHCRFCPAKLRCGALGNLAKAAAEGAQAADNGKMADDTLFRELALKPAVLSYLKALEDEAYRRLVDGADGAGIVKLVNKKADRQWKPEAMTVLDSRFGKTAYTDPKPKSPAQIDALPGGKEFTREWAFAPQTGYSVALASDPRTAVKPEKADPAAKFGGLTKTE